MEPDLKHPMDLAEAIAPYRGLLEDLVARSITPDEFESRYLVLYSSDDRELDDDVFERVDAFFADVDAFVADPELRARSRDGIGPDDLRVSAASLLAAARRA